MALRKHLAFRDPAAVGSAFKLEGDIIPQEILAELIFPRPVAVDGQPNAENNLCVDGPGLLHGPCNSRKGQDEGVLFSGFVLLEAQTGSPDA
jgi:hypothetical protein